MIVFNRAVKWWDEELKEAIRVRRERYTLDKHRAKLRQDVSSML